MSKYVKYGMFIYIVMFTVYSLVGRIIPALMFVGENINGYIFIGFALAGSCLVAIDFFLDRGLFKGRHCWLLYVFVCIMLVSSIVNIRYGYSSNIKTIVWTVIQIAIFYCAAVRINKEQMLRYLYWVFHIISWIWTIAVIYSLKQYIMMDSYGIETKSGKWIYQGFRASRLFGIFNDPNYAAVTSLWVILMLVFIMYKTRKKWLRVFCGAACMCNGIYIILSNSRTAALCIIVGGFCGFFLLLKNKFSTKGVVLAFFLRIVITCFVIFILIGAAGTVKKALTYLPEKYLEYRIGRQEGTEKTNKEIDLIERKENISKVGAENILQREDAKSASSNTKRIRIWRNYVNATKDVYFFGASPRNIETHMQQEHPQIYERNEGYETHNGFISLFAGTGLLGVLCVLVFMVLTGKRICRYCFGEREISFEFIIFFSIIVMIVVYTCFFTELFFVNNLTTSLFWILLGTLTYWTEESDVKYVECADRE